MNSAVTDMLSILNLEPIGPNLFRGQSPQVEWQRVFGGQVIGQALVAACRTVQDRTLHSLHGYFILPGDPKVPIDYEVDNVRDGRSFTTRRVRAFQHDKVIFFLSASFHVEEQGLHHQVKMPDVPPPESLPDDRDIAARILPHMPNPLRIYHERQRPIDLRPVEIERYMSREPREPQFNVWIKASTALPDNPEIHQCVLAYASDMTLLDTSLVAHGRTVFDKNIQPASLDHSLWLHAPFRADEWLLYSQDSPFSGGSRGFARGQIFTRDGRLVASVAQEGLIRLRHPE